MPNIDFWCYNLDYVIMASNNNNNNNNNNIIASTYKAPLTPKGSLGAVQLRVLKDILEWIYNIKSYIKTTTKIST